MKKVAIIGGGILGLSIAFKLSKLKYKVHLYDKDSKIGNHQSGKNSGVLHCGLSYRNGSLKANLSVNGIKSMIEFCQKNEINHEICGKLVVANNDDEFITLDKLFINGNLNGLKGVRYLSKTEIKKREPFVKAKKAIIVPEEGIVDYKEVMNVLSNKIKSNGSKIFLGNKVLNIKDSLKNKTVLISEKFEKEYDLIINCSGLFSDRTFSKFTKNISPIKIIPFRGEYFKLSKKYESLVNHLIYPVPDFNFPFLGVHFTRMHDGSREVGPNAVLAFKREGYKKTDFSFYDTFDSLSFKGLRKFIFKNLRFTIGELKSSLFKDEFIKKAKNLIPEIEDYMLVNQDYAGVRAQAMSKTGDLIMDFNIIREKNQIHILNAPSPGATASLAIADYVINNYI